MIAEDGKRKPAALITGGAVRLGRAMCMSLAKRGYDIALHYKASRHEAETALKSLLGFGARAVLLQADLLQDDEIQNLVPRACSELGRPLTLLVNNASIFKNDSIQSATFETWDEHVHTNLKAPFFLTRDFVNQLPKASQEDENETRALGLVVNIVDQRVLKPTPYFASYTVAKMALWSFTRSAAIALAPQVRVNAIGPGPAMKASFQTSEHFESQKYNTILRCGSSPQEVVQALNYLIDAQSVTGQLICPDGGQHLTWNPKYFGEDY